MDDIIYIGGGKGGVGKSKLAFATLDYLTDSGTKPLLIESDTSNPDVLKAHANDENIVCREVDLDTPDGWIEIVNACEEFKGRPVVINSAARNEKGVAKYADTLSQSLGELSRNLKIFWIINRQRDSLELLKNFMNYCPSQEILVWRNLYFGPEEKFELFNKSKLKIELEHNNGATLNFPDLADRVADKLYSGRKSIQQALHDLPIGDRAELRRWRIEYFKPMKLSFKD